jgi:ABC-type Na+ efflux pump permease subunit
VYEHSSEPLLPRQIFLGRVVRSFLVAAVAMGAWLLIGTLGYHSLAKLGWIDALLNASMILSGMGPVDPLPNDTAKVFASIYAIFSGVVFLSTSAILVAPVVHRLMHRFHLRKKAEE